MPKLKKVQLVLAGIFTILFFRFYHLQIYQQSKYEEKAGNNSVRKISIHAPRGIIYDRNGYRYHGRIKAIADSIREKGIKF